MSYELVLLRHAKSDWFDSDWEKTGTDFTRPITDRGKRGAQHIGVWLAQNEFIPEYIISSPAERAKLTAQKMIKAMGKSAHDIIYDKRIYEAELNDLLELIHTLPKKAKKVILVGHNPGLEELLFYLSDKEIPIPADGKVLATASAAHLSFSCEWRQIKKHYAELISIQRAKKLAKGFPYPDVNSDEQRIRPAYYYTQSSVIPYRYYQGQLEIMLVLSSKKKHYVIPKGIQEPGLSARESAAKEALEEAGIKGNVALDPIGSYRYTKWQASCIVSVYPMEVTSILDEQYWEESHRGRQWLKPDIAVQKLHQQALKPILHNLIKTLQSSI